MQPDDEAAGLVELDPLGEGVPVGPTPRLEGEPQHSQAPPALTGQPLVRLTAWLEVPRRARAGMTAIDATSWRMHLEVVRGATPRLRLNPDGHRRGWASALNKIESA